MSTAQLRRAGPGDIDLLVPLRLEVLRAANGLAADAPLPGIEEATRRYYAERLGAEGGSAADTPASNSGVGAAHIEYLAYTKGALAACGAASLYDVMPTNDNPTGRKAYIMNMYTRPAYRRRGYARQLLAALVHDVQALGVTHIALEATAAGRPLYEAFGFVPMGDEMIYKPGQAL